MAFMADDKVVYIGKKFARDINSPGWIISTIKNEKDMYCVEFNGDSYVMPGSSLEKTKPVNDSVEFIRRNRKYDDLDS